MTMLETKSKTGTMVKYLVQVEVDNEWKNTPFKTSNFNKATRQAAYTMRQKQCKVQVRAIMTLSHEQLKVSQDYLVETGK